MNPMDSLVDIRDEVLQRLMDMYRCRVAEAAAYPERWDEIRPILDGISQDVIELLEDIRNKPNLEE